jgi:hypothetical protein
LIGMLLVTVTAPLGLLNGQVSPVQTPQRNTCLASIVNGSPRVNPGVQLGIARPESLPAASRQPLRVALYLENVGSAPVYVSPGLTELGGCVRLLARKSGSKDGPTVLFNLEHSYHGFDLDDLFKLLPGRMTRYTILVDYRPIATRGEIDIWAEYDGREMSRGDKRALAVFLRSPILTVPVRRTP